MSGNPLFDYYATQPSAHDEYHALEAEAAERGMLPIEVEKEHRLAERDRRVADAARVQALINAGHQVWRDGSYVWEPATELPALGGKGLPTPPQAPPEPSPPSSGRNISPPRQR